MNQHESSNFNQHLYSLKQKVRLTPQARQKWISWLMPLVAPFVVRHATVLLSPLSAMPAGTAATPLPKNTLGASANL